MTLDCSRVLLALLAATLLAASASARPAVPGPPRPADLAARIDARLEARWKADRVQPAPVADDGILHANRATAQNDPRACLGPIGFEVVLRGGK